MISITPIEDLTEYGKEFSSFEICNVKPDVYTSNSYTDLRIRTFYVNDRCFAVLIAESADDFVTKAMLADNYMSSDERRIYVKKLQMDTEVRHPIQQFTDLHRIINEAGCTLRKAAECLIECCWNVDKAILKAKEV